MSENPLAPAIKLPENIQTPDVNIPQILAIVAETEIDPDKFKGYLNPKVTPPQSLDKSLESSMRTIFERTKQRITNIPAYQIMPEAMNVWGEIARLGTAAKYIFDVSEGKSAGGVNTHPFSDTSWDISPERVEEIAKATRGQLETAKAFLEHQNPTLPENETDAMPLIAAICYLKVSPLLEVKRSGFTM